MDMYGKGGIMNNVEMKRHKEHMELRSMYAICDDARKTAASEVEYLRAALQDIVDIAYDRDGFTSAEKLGELVDELYKIAAATLDGSYKTHDMQIEEK